jgi:hypothetical protein
VSALAGIFCAAYFYTPCTTSVQEILPGNKQIINIRIFTFQAFCNRYLCWAFLKNYG